MITDSRLKKLHYQSWHRGTKENDLLLGRFADNSLENLTPEQLDQFEALLQLTDDVLFQAICGATQDPAMIDQNNIIRLIKNFHKLQIHFSK